MVDHLKQRQVKAYKAVFDEYRNDNKEVEYRHLESILNSLGHNPTEMEMEEIYEHLDIYCEGSVGFAHFLTLMANRFSKEEIAAKERKKTEDEEELEKEMREAFKVFDGDGNGFISQAELKHALLNMGETLDDDEIEDMMNEADKDGDGQISFPEFCGMMTTTATITAQ